MTRALMDYVSARHEALVAVLEMLTAEYQLSDESSSVLAVTDADCEVDVAAAKLAEAADELEIGRRPAGWSDPPAVAGDLGMARRRFVAAALRCLAADCAQEHSSADAESEYATGQLALAARNLAADAELARAARANKRGRLV